MSSSNGSIPNGNHSAASRKDEGVVVRFPIHAVVIGTLILPFIGFLVCIVTSVIRDFEGSTHIVCSDLSKGKIANYLPSISASIGNFTPQRYVWRITFSLHLTPRFLFAIMHYKYNMSFPVTYKRPWYKILNRVACVAHFMEITGLILVTYVSSAENFPVHEKGFMMFVFGALLYVICVLVIFYWARHGMTWSSEDIRSFRIKVVCFCVMFFSTFTAYYFYTRHMQYCEPMVYSGFSLFEYILVLGNLGFHGSWMLLDFLGAQMKVSIPPRLGQYTSLPV